MFLRTLDDYCVLVSHPGLTRSDLFFCFFFPPRLFDGDSSGLFLGIPEVSVHRQANNSNRMNLSQAMQRPGALSAGCGGGGGEGRRAGGGLLPFQRPLRDLAAAGCFFFFLFFQSAAQV